MGELDQKVAIRRATLEPDGCGGNYKVWSTVATVCAHVRPSSGGETTRYDRVNAEAMYRFVFHNRPGLLESDKLVWNGVDYNIRFIHRRTCRNLYLEVDAQRGVAQ